MLSIKYIHNLVSQYAFDIIDIKCYFFDSITIRTNFLGPLVLDL